MKLHKQQRGAVDIEGYEELAEKARQREGTQPSSGGQRQHAPTRQRKAITRFLIRSLILLVVAAVVVWVLHMCRYEIIPLDSQELMIAKYLVRDRWTGEIEVVWQPVKGEVRRSTRRLFE